MIVARVLFSVLLSALVWTANAETPYIFSSDGPSQEWRDVAMAADGSIRAGVVNNGHIWVFTDSSSSWTEKTGVTGASKSWTTIAMSTDGSKMAALGGGPGAGTRPALP